MFVWWSPWAIDICLCNLCNKTIFIEFRSNALVVCYDLTLSTAKRSVTNLTYSIQFKKVQVVYDKKQLRNAKTYKYEEVIQVGNGPV